jgi:hypothetical protein
MERNMLRAAGRRIRDLLATAVAAATAHFARIFEPQPRRRLGSVSSACRCGTGASKCSTSHRLHSASRRAWHEGQK